jgi:hypothetical protein
MKRPVHEIAEIFQRYWKQYCQNHRVSAFQKKVVLAIKSCRSAALGGHRVTCTNDDCDYEQQSYNSCRNRHCPKCQGSKQLEWVHQRLQELLPIPYFHQVFTMPPLLNPLALFNKALIYDIFFNAAAETLKAFAADPKYLNAKLGFIAIMHTWGQTLSYHVHLHFIVTGGGITADGRQFKRLPYGKKFLFPSRAMSRTLRARFVELLKQAYADGKLQFPDEMAQLRSADAFTRFCVQVGQQAWYNYTSLPFTGPKKLLAYLSRYTHRVAISNHRIKSVEDGQVCFEYKDYRDNHQIKTMTLEAEHFIQRFLWHIFPAGFKRIRYYGFLAPGCRAKQLEVARTALNALCEQAIQCREGMAEWWERFGAFLERQCPKCHTGKLVYQLIMPWDSS